MKKKIDVIPYPKEVTKTGGEFVLSPDDFICCEDNISDIGEICCNMLNLKRGDNGRIQLIIDENINGCEAYKLHIKKDEVIISASQTNGLFYGIQTFRQLLPVSIEKYGIDINITIPCMSIADNPRFEHRGLLLDCSRHFFDVETIKRTLDLMALHKLNMFHWHLSDDQGFRVESKLYPRLHEVGSTRKLSDRVFKDMYKIRNAIPSEGYYTKKQIKDIVEYAKVRGIEIIPEVDFPGHLAAILEAYPQYACPVENKDKDGNDRMHDLLCLGNDDAIQFAINITLETAELFSSKKIHIGGDECAAKIWEKCPKCQEKMKKEGIEDIKDFQTYFTNLLSRSLVKEGYEVIGYNEILNDQLDGSVISQYWTPLNGAGKIAKKHIKAGRKTIIAPLNRYYLDYPFYIFPLKYTYNFNPLLKGLPRNSAENIIGIESSMWTEHVADVNRLDWQMFPRLTAIAERAWSQKKVIGYNDFLHRLSVLEKRYEKLGVTFCKSECYKKRWNIFKALDGWKEMKAKNHPSNIEFKKYNQ